MKLQWNPSREAIPLMTEKWPFQREWPLKRGSTVFKPTVNFLYHR